MLSRTFRLFVVKVGSSRRGLRSLYSIWRAVPYPLRRVGTALFILYTLGMKKLFKVDANNALTPADELGNLSFWGVPDIDLVTYRLQIGGSVEQPISLSFNDLSRLPSITREVRMDCVGGFRNNTVMEGVPLKALLDGAGVMPGVQRVVFHCADGYYSSLELQELIQREAFLVYSMNGEGIPKFGFPLRLAIPGKYGYQWAKWVVRIELVTDQRKGHWAALGLPDRGDLGDVW